VRIFAPLGRTFSDYSIVKERPPCKQRAAIDAAARTASISNDGGAPAERRARTAEVRIAGRSQNSTIYFPDLSFCACRYWRSVRARFENRENRGSLSWAYSRRICFNRRSMPDPSRVRSGWRDFVFDRLL